MRIRMVMALLTLLHGTLGICGTCEELCQDSTRSWGEPAFGIRCSISVGKPSISKADPLVVSVILENTAGTRIDLKTISAFDLSNTSKTAPESTLKFGSYWCPVNLMEGNSSGKAGMTPASTSRLVMEKGASIRATMDLARQGWDKRTSSWWPVRDLNTIVAPGRYLLRLDIQVGTGADLKWIRSNEVMVVLTK